MKSATRLMLLAALGLPMLVAPGCGASSPSTAQSPAQVKAPSGNQPLTMATGTPSPVQAEAVAWSDARSPIPVTSADPVWGERNAPVTLVVFGDIQCPFCSRLLSTVQKLQGDYGPQKLRVVWKHLPLPFHPNAAPAALAAATVRAIGGQEAFWHWLDLALEHQQELSDEAYESWAVQCGVNREAYRQAMSASSYASKVEQDKALAAQLGVKGTPGSFVNGVFISGAQPQSKFADAIDAQLKKAQELRDQNHVPADQIYVTASIQNFADNPPAKPHADADADEDEDKVDATVWKVPVEKSPVRGPASALVTIVMFSDFQCPFCSRVEPTLERLRTQYGDKLRIVWKDNPLPFHKRAEPAAVFAREARKQKGDAGFWAAHDKLFANQTALEDADLERYAAELHLNWPKIKRALEQNSYHADIQKDLNLADDLKASGTPHFFINGRRFVGAQPFEAFQSLIDEELGKAQEQVKKGTPAARVYDTLQAKAKAGGEELQTVQVPAPTPRNPFRGGANAKVVVQVFSDFQCPFCGRAEETIAQVQAKYGNRVKIVWRNMPLPFHNNAQMAAEAAMEVFKQKGHQGFWQYHDKLFANQKTPGGLERPALEQYAQELGVNMDQFRAALEKQTHKAEVEADAAIASQAQIHGTPTFVINNYLLVGAQPIGKFEKLIDKALAEPAGARPRK